MQFTKRGLRYLRGTVSQGLKFSRDQKLVGLSNADFALGIGLGIGLGLGIRKRN